MTGLDTYRSEPVLPETRVPATASPSEAMSTQCVPNGSEHLFKNRLRAIRKGRQLGMARARISFTGSATRNRSRLSCERPWAKALGQVGQGSAPVVLVLDSHQPGLAGELP